MEHDQSSHRRGSHKHSHRRRQSRAHDPRRDSPAARTTGANVHLRREQSERARQPASDSRFVLHVADTTRFSWDVSVQKARTALFFSSSNRAFSARTVGSSRKACTRPASTRRNPFVFRNAGTLLHHHAHRDHGDEPGERRRCS